MYFFLFLLAVSILDPSGSGAEGTGRWAACPLSAEQRMPGFCPVPHGSPGMIASVVPNPRVHFTSTGLLPRGLLTRTQARRRSLLPAAAAQMPRGSGGCATPPPVPRAPAHLPACILLPAASGHKARNPWLSPFPFKCLYHYCNYFTMCGNSLRI